MYRIRSVTRQAKREIKESKGTKKREIELRKKKRRQNYLCEEAVSKIIPVTGQQR